MRKIVLICALICSVAVFAGPLSGAADAKKKKKNVEVLRPGKYFGATEDGGSVTFTLTRHTIVGFTLTNATLYCITHPVTDFHLFPETKAEYTKVITLTHAPFQMTEVTKKQPQGKKFTFSDPFSDTAPSAGGLWQGKLAPMQRGFVQTGTGMAGEVEYGTNNGPIGVSGTELCITHFIDWEAKRPGDRGLVAIHGSGPLGDV